MTFNTLEEMAKFYDQNKDDYTMTFGETGARLLDRDYNEVAYVEDDRAAAIALNLLIDMMLFSV